MSERIPHFKSRFKSRHLWVWMALLLITLLATAWGARKVWLQVLDRRQETHAAQAVVDPARVNYRVAAAHPRILLNHAATLAHITQQWRSRASSAVRFQEMVDAQMAGRDQYGFQPWFAALAFRMTGDALYARFAVAQTDAWVAAEEALITQNRTAQVAGDSYLHVGETIGSLSLVYDWCFELLTPAQRSRWVRYANQSVWNVWHPAQAQWGDKVHAWTGWSVNNPSNNYYYSFLRASMLLGLASHAENDQAATWLNIFRVEKLEAQLFPTFDRDLTGGGSREGTGYGTAMTGLFELLDWWEKSTGERLATRTPHTLASVAHMLHSVTPTLTHLAPTGDHSRDSAAALFDYHREYLLQLMSLFPQERLSGTAQSFLAASSVPRMSQGYNVYIDLLYGDSAVAPLPLSELAITYWGAGTGQLMMRSSWNKDAVFANFICGPLTESHAHRDQGSFVIHHGEWLATDANTLSHSGIEQAESLHNLVRFELAGVPMPQNRGTTCQLKNLADNALYTYAMADVTPLYHHRPGVTQVEREFVFIKPSTFVVLDRTRAGVGTRRIWTLNVPNKPVVDGDRLHYEGTTNPLDVLRLSPTGLKTELVPWPGANREVLSGWRIDVADNGANPAPFLHVLSTAGPLKAVRVDAAPEQIATRIPLPDGREALLRFNLNSPGGHLQLKTAAGGALLDAALPAGVQPLELFVTTLDK
jgi:hypothetical protein